MSTTILLVMCVFLIILCQSNGADDKTCQFYYNGLPLSEYQWNIGIDLNIISDVELPYKGLLNISCKNIQEIKDITVNNQPNKYINTILVSDPLQENIKFIMALRKEFSQYEEYETSNKLKINITFLCGDGKSKSLEIRQSIFDTNNHNPELIPSYYEFNTSFFLPADHLIGKISAQDVDLSNERVTFKFKANEQNVLDNFAIIGTYRDPDNKKIFHSWLVTTKETTLTKNLTFAITVQDSGVPQRSWSGLVDLKVFWWNWNTTTTPTISTIPTTTTTPDQTTLHPTEQPVPTGHPTEQSEPTGHNTEQTVPTTGHPTEQPEPTGHNTEQTVPTTGHPSEHPSVPADFTTGYLRHLKKVSKTSGKSYFTSTNYRSLGNYIN